MSLSLEALNHHAMRLEDLLDPFLLDPHRISSLRKEYIRTPAFTHLIVDGFLNAQIAEKTLEEFGRTRGDWVYYRQFTNKKRGFNRIQNMGPWTRSVLCLLQSRDFLSWVEKITGLEQLQSDPELDGGGLQEFEQNGFLNIHRDFLSHPRKPNWSRQVNLILYLNKGWKPAFGGDLELWNWKEKRCIKKIAPEFNRLVLFKTTNTSFHGVPDKIRCQRVESRKSINLYFYKRETLPVKLEPTYYVSRPSDSLMKKGLVFVDRAMLRLYGVLKRRFPLPEERITKIMKIFSP